MQNSDAGEDGQTPGPNAGQTPVEQEDDTSPVVSGDGEDEQSFFHDDDGSDDTDQDADDQPLAEADLEAEAAQSITWEGEEFVHHQKDVLWYLKLLGLAVLFSAVIYLLTKDVVTVCVIIVGAILFAVYASRKPRRIPYAISPRALQINGRRLPLGDFRSFSTVKEGSTHSIIFTPMKRFAPLATIYYPQDREDEIVGFLTNALPMTDFQQDAVDKLLHKIRF